MKPLVIFVIVCAALGVILLTIAGSVRLVREHALSASCQSNVRQLACAAIMYAHDWDGTYPPRGYQADWAARRWTAKLVTVADLEAYHLDVGEAGPLWPYMENAAASRCPSDPDNRFNSYAAAAHSSYEWNQRLLGQKLTAMPEQSVVWDNAPRHRHGRNVGYSSVTADGLTKGEWVSEESFRAAQP